MTSTSTTTSAPTSSTTPPRLGEIWPGQGGIYAGLVRGDAGGPDFHLIVPTAPQAYHAAIAWGGRGTDEPGAKHERDGLANTIALVQSQHDHPAAKWAAGLEIEGLHDFYLPSRRELRLCWVNVPELFAEGWYWSSTQYSPDLAWLQYFDGGLQGNDLKSFEARARAVRRFIP